ncbi:MAG: FtsX-like permease family protein [Theionarchaea archaeon]|nr:FtsX-like permease family protein [Theionarchaea archaeon]
MLKIVARSLTGQKVRVFLTMLTLGVGVMVFVSLSALLQGLEFSVYHTFEGFSTQRDILLVEGTVELPVPVQAVSGCTVEERTLPARPVLIKHVDFIQFERLSSISLVEGSYPAAGNECIVEYFFSEKEGITLGATLFEYTVVGIFFHQKGFYTHVISPLPGTGYVLTEIKVDPEQYNEIALQIPSAIPARELSYFFSKGTVNLYETLRQMLGIVVAILVLSVFLSMNTAVLERKWEIGVLRALGAKKSFILRLFLYESVIISFLAAGIGIALGIIFSNSLTVFFSEIQQVKGIQPVITATLLVEAVAGPLLIGVLGGILPAYRASRMDIAECLVM